MNINSCSFCGPNLLRFNFGFDEEDDLCLQIKETMRLQILDMYNRNVKNFYTDCEIGVPMWGAELVADLMRQFNDIQLFCILPYEEQATKWSPDQRDRYFSILEKSSMTKYIHAKYTDSCYRDCGRYLVDHTDNVIALYDNDPILPLNIASQFVSNARQKSKTIIYIDPDSGLVRSKDHTLLSSVDMYI